MNVAKDLKSVNRELCFEKFQLFNTSCKVIYESDDKASGFSAIEIAEKLNIQRTNACSDLNALIREGRIEKIKGKPVLYTVNNYEKPAKRDE
ncbi:hypothetical protein K2F40_08985 [Clostridium sp. CM028]|uniref:hypothetical protein n=1 Tax=Clostridium sp. CM028 TaxID=2851575 RepID=UPI001C6DD630|nr:hypothetical protein [Clostridium sp. CM028]MBW9149093.1 hypothetical protein [Clostridium sp. CM028]WLC62642.1 hypothetical protein KTC94_05065 [Clostridium sp. CM028]